MVADKGMTPERDARGDSGVGGASGDMSFPWLEGLSGVAALAHDQDGNLISANAEARVLFGDAGLQSRAFLDGFRSADGTELAAGLHPVRQTLLSGLAQQRVLLGYDREDGRRCWLRVGSAVLPFESRPSPRVVLSTYFDITCLRESQQQHERDIEALERSQVLLQGVSTLSGVGAWEQDLRTSTLTWSPQTYAIYDLDPSIVPTLDAVRALRAPETQQEIDASTKDAIEFGKPATIEFETRTFKGRLIRVRSVRQVQRINGEAMRVLGTAEDVTQQHRDDVARQRSASLLEEVSEMGGVGGWEYDRRSHVLTWSRQARMIFGVDETVTPSTQLCWSLVTPASLPLVRAGFHEAILSGRRTEREYEIVRPDGRRVWLRSFCDAEREGGRVVRLVGTIQDITARKVAAAELQAATDRLIAALGAAELRMWEIDLEAGTVSVDPRSSVAADQCDVGSPMSQESMYEIVHPDDRARVREQLEEVARTGIPLKTRWRILSPRSGERLLEQRVRLCVGFDGRQRLAGVARDVTEEAQLSSQLDLKRREAEAASAAKSEFVARMSHEIRTPMNGVIGMLEVLQRSRLGADQHDHAVTALKSARDLMHVLDDVIDIARLEARQVAVEQAAYRPRDVVGDVVGLFGARANERAIVLDADIPRDLPAWIHGDARRVRQVLTNLVGNAIKFTQSGAIRVAVTYEPDMQRAKFAVSDTGLGMTPETISRLFSQFYQADTSPTRPYGGSGLGLAICKQLVELMGGEIWVESAIGKGSTFWFTVRAPVAEAPGVETPYEAAPSIPPLRILIVEDNPANQKILATLLGAEGHSLAIADNGQDGVARAASEEFDLVLMDVMMPVMDGLAATRRIRELGGRAGGIPIIAMTANALLGDRDRYLAAGMTDYISKPLDIVALFRAIARAADSTMSGRSPALPDEAGRALPAATRLNDEGKVGHS